MGRPRDLVILLACLLTVGIYFTVGLVVFVALVHHALAVIQAEVR